MSHDLDTFKHWVFDLDNTLYDAKSKLFEQVANRMTLFIQTQFDMDETVAAKLRHKLFKAYGSTMSGLVKDYDIAPRDYLDFVHDVPLEAIAPNPELDALIEQLPGNKLIFTSGCRRHVGRVLERLGIARHFSGIQDIVDSGLRAKPTPEIYDLFIETWEIDPKASIMFEDMACNLRPAYERGMRTVWIESDYDWAQADGFEDVITWRTPDVTSWLRSQLYRDQP